jgi:hypothetical protein
MTVLRHDGRRRQVALDAHPTLGAAIDACLAADREAEVVVAVRVDGREFAADDLAELRALASEGVGALELVTRPRDGVARDALESAADYAPGLAAAIARAAALLREGELARAHALWADACEALDVLVHALAGIGAALPGAREALAAIGAELAAPLAAAADAHARGDWLGLADVLEYEIGARVAASRERLAALRAGASAAGEARA